jgi:crotonobetainyl-CoA:carnitine CoA-transferase CaiB-like acyl-CoA transferase
LNTPAPPLQGLLVVEHGDRLGAAVCGSILAHLGAEVVVLEHTAPPTDHKWVNRAAAVMGKRSLAPRADETEAVARLCACADIVILSGDLAPAPKAVHAWQIVCNITAFGQDGPYAGMPYSDTLLQALAGIADTTGDPGAPPSLIGLPFCEVSAGVYAAAAVLVALRVRRLQGMGQRIDVALYDCAIAALSTFLPFHAAGKPVSRSGNRHSLAAPWNAYQAKDGWVLICTATDEQWKRLCTLIGEVELALKPGYVTNAERIGKRAEVDAVISRWTATQTVNDCIERLAAIDIACGPILPLAQLEGEANLVLRQMIWRSDGVTLPGSPLAASLPLSEKRLRLPVRDEFRADLSTRMERKTLPALAQRSAGSPLANLTVLEIGQYTTAPLVGRQLGMLGAQVYKIEPPGGEGSRAWPPVQGDRGYFFAMSNNDKRSLELNLQDTTQRELFVKLLNTADVLVENLKPGSLARLGFGVSELHAINPRLIYCGISGFGARSIFPGRPAFDTVVQAMSGMMDVTRSLGAPVKAGISAADIVGGEYGLLAILAALELREQSGHGMAIDISMQDAAVSATTSLWNRITPVANAHFVRCANGYVCMECAAVPSALAAQAVTQTRDAIVASAQAAGLAAAPVLTVSEAANSAQTRARGLIVELKGDDGRVWPIVTSAIRLSRTPAVIHSAIGDLGEANARFGLQR